MHRWTDLADTPPHLRPCVATFGNFDGVHRGHQGILGRLREAGATRGLPTVAVTFEPHPVTLFHPERDLRLISPGVLRDELIAGQGIDGLLVLEFTRELAATSARDWVVSTFVEGLGARVLVVGEDTRGFGAGYTGDVGLLREIGQEHGFEVVVCADMGDGERWSSSAVRTHLAAGEVEDAAAVLGRPHRLVGTVVHGHHRGRELGYPTANLSPDALGLVPADGVYAGWLTRPALPDGAPDHRLPAAISIGTNPTFDDVHARQVEAYVLDRDDLDLYDERVCLDLVAPVRPTERFDSVEELLVAMAGDVEACRRILTTTEETR